MQDINIAKNILEHHLPDAVKQKINLDTLCLEDGSFVDSELKSLHTDMLYSVPLLILPLMRKPISIYILNIKVTMTHIFPFGLLRGCKLEPPKILSHQLVLLTNGHTGTLSQQQDVNVTYFHVIAEVAY